MIQIQPREYTTGTATLLHVTATIADGSGAIWYKLLSADNKIVTEGNLPVDTEFALAYNGSEIMAGNYIANYLGVVIL
jgi:hypothetical protein